MRIHRVHALLAATLLIAACHHKASPTPLTLGAAFRRIPLPPNGQALVQEGGADAMQMVFVTPAQPDSVLAYYRQVLSADPFRLVNERTSGKTSALYAEQDGGPPIWVTIAPNGNEGSQVILAGARDATTRDSSATAKGIITGDSGATTTLPVRKP